jgi:hypothetical protein
MYALSAADAISPAVQRTKTFLFKPFRWGTYLKLCLVALVTEGLGGNFSNSWNSGRNHRHAPTTGAPFTFSPLAIATMVAALALALLLGFFIYYLITRLRFAYFHCLIHNTREIRPGWHLYRTQASRFFWFNVVVAWGFLLLLAVIFLPFFAGFMRLYRESQAGEHPGVGAILTLALPLIPIILVVALLAVATDLILRDFMLPHFALDDATPGEAWHEVWARIMTEKGSFLGYALLRVVLPLVAIMALAVVLAIPAILFVVMAAIFAVAIHAAFADASGAAFVVKILLEVMVGLVSFAVLMFVGICLGGPLSTAVREYALLFYGGRYPRLGDILFPPLPVNPNPPIPNMPVPNVSGSPAPGTA